MSTETKELTREEILGKRISIFPSTNEMTNDAIKRNVYKTMSEYAAQEVAKEREKYDTEIERLKGLIKEFVQFDNISKYRELGIFPTKEDYEVMWNEFAKRNNL